MVGDKSWEVRRADIDDAQVIAELNQHVHILHAEAEPDDFYDIDPADAVGFFEGLFENGSHLLFVAVDAASATIGYVWAQEQERPANPFTKPARTMYVHHVAVAPEDRGRGVGKSLVAAVEDEARQRTISRIALDHWTFNESAHRFFSNLGFQPYNLRMRRDLGHG